MSEPASFDRAHLTVLIADDESENAAAFGRALRGYQVHTATRGDEALAVLAEHRVDIVLADQCMPGTTGALVLQRARAINPLVRRVIVSASASSQNLLEAINQGEVERYLLKPIEAAQLREVVDKLAQEYQETVRQKQKIVELQDQIQMLRRRMSSDLPDGWDRLELEVVRARRYERPLTLVVVEGAAPSWSEFGPALREIDLLVPIGARLILALPETARAAGDAVVKRLASQIGRRQHGIATFPEDGNDLAALLAAAQSRQTK